MVEGNASMYLGSPRMAEMVINEQTTLEEMGGARMHATVSGCGDNLAVDDADAIDQAKAFFTYLPSLVAAGRRRATRRRRRRGPSPPTSSPPRSTSAYDVHDVIDALVDAESFFEVKPLFAPELVTGFALLEGRPVGIVANNPAAKGGVLFVDSADKAARFIWVCDAFNVPLVFLADVPGFMIGTEVERQGIIRHGAKMVTAVSRGDGAEGVGDPAQGLRRRAVRHVGAGLRARGDPRPAHGEDRGDGPGGGGQRRVRQQDRRHRGSPTSGPRSSPSSGGCTRRTSTCCAWRRELVVDAVVAARPTSGPRSSPAWRWPRARTATSATAATASRPSDRAVPWCDDCAKFWNPNSVPTGRAARPAGPSCRARCATTST